MSEKFSGVRRMRELIAAVAGERSWNETRESWFARAARQTGVSFRQVKAAFYGEISDDNHRTARLLKDAADRKGKQEASQLANQFEQIARAIDATDSNFHGEDVAALLHAARMLRGLDRPGTEG